MHPQRRGCIFVYTVLFAETVFCGKLCKGRHTALDSFFRDAISYADVAGISKGFAGDKQQIILLCVCNEFCLVTGGFYPKVKRACGENAVKAKLRKTVIKQRAVCGVA